MNIGRTLFWFLDGDKQLISLNEDFFGVATLLNRLLNEKYEGKKIKFINLNFSTNKTYELHPLVPKGTPYFYGGHLTYYGLLDINQFEILNWNEKKHFVWENAYEYIKKSAKFTRNNNLLDAIEYAYVKGIENNLNPDFRLLNLSINFSNKELKVSLWINFREDCMYSNLIVEYDTRIIFERQIDKTHKGVEFFLEMYKALDFDENSIIIKGFRDYLPLKISLSEVTRNI